MESVERSFADLEYESKRYAASGWAAASTAIQAVRSSVVFVCCIQQSQITG